MTWGDALASVVGQRIGRRKYSVPGSTRSVEGSVTMFLVSWVATAVALLILAPDQIEVLTALGISAVTALGAAAVEAISPWGIDNLTVPAASVVLLFLLI
jgi:phytol kinase